MKKIFICVAVISMLLAHSSVSMATTANAPADSLVVEEKIVQEDLLEVNNLIIDKIAANAVVAKSEAITTAKRAAFLQLAERHMSPEELATLELPDDKVIALTVQNFQITDEKISATRYVGTFTVRFRKSVSHYINIAFINDEEANVTSVVSNTGPRNILVVPYFETAGGQLTLWSDNNPWLKIWQNTPPFVFGWTISVPLGDISDIAAGSATGVLNGNTALLEQLQRNYGADEVIVTVINLTGHSAVLDIYIYKNTRLGTRTSVMSPITVGNEKHTLKQATQAVITQLQQSKEGKPATTGSFVSWPDGTPANPVESMTVIDARMQFRDFSQWVDLQRRITSSDASVTLELKALTSNDARLKLKLDGSMEVLHGALSAVGVIMVPVANGAYYMLELVSD